MDGIPTKIASLPGVKRDGTQLEGGNYLDGQWCRFQRGLPRKIGGYLSISQNLAQLIYGMHSFSANARQFVHLGSESQLQQRVVNNSGVVTGQNDRTPAGLVPSASNIWQFDAIFDVDVGYTALVGNPPPNMDIDSTVTADIFFGDVTDPGLLILSGQDPVSGGVLVVGNYLVGFGEGGYVQWSEANKITSPTDDADNVTQQKIITGQRVRGGGVPAALLWSLDSLLQMTFNDPATQLWDFDTISDQISILSSRCVVEYDGVFYWPGVDRFSSYNGVVREVPNNFNVNWFYDNLNFQQRQKVFGIKVPRFGEIWWFYPRGSATECTHAVIMNVREGYWYDTEITGGRTDGIFAKVYNKPFMMGATETMDGFDLWQHETGKDQVRVGVVEPIPAHFETAEMSLATQEQGAENNALSIGIIEPDFVQVGDMTVTVKGRENARVTTQTSAPATITPVATDSDEQVVRVKETRRLLSLRFDTNVAGGDFEMGEPLMHVTKTDARITR